MYNLEKQIVYEYLAVASLLQFDKNVNDNILNFTIEKRKFQQQVYHFSTYSIIRYRKMRY